MSSSLLVLARCLNYTHPNRALFPHPHRSTNQPKAQRDIMIQLLIFFQIYLAALDPPVSSLPYHTARTRHLVEACRSLVDLSRQPGFPAELDGPPVLGAVIAERLLTPGGSERAKAAVREVAETWDPLRVCHARRLSPPCNTTGSLQACSRVRRGLISFYHLCSIADVALLWPSGSANR